MDILTALNFFNSNILPYMIGIIIFLVFLYYILRLFKVKDEDQEEIENE